MQKRNTYLIVGMALSMILAIWAIISVNTDSLPSWTIAIPGIVAGFWWAFGQQVVGGGNARHGDEGRPQKHGNDNA